jgi:8-oxo-dGTP pyrophosphatase MutT (NUDIX family)
MPTPLSLLRQAAVVPVLNSQVCLVTSRNGKRWVVPKGCMEAGKSACEVALQEAWEEAGLVGLIDPDPLGSYFYEKDGLTCHVIVFLLTVTGQVDSYPESVLRQRLWLTTPQAALRVEDAGLREIIRGVGAQKAG